MTSLKALILDLDGLIVDTEPLHMRAFNLLLEMAGEAYRFEAEEYGPACVGIAVEKNADYIVRRFGLPYPPEEMARTQVALFSLLASDPRNLRAMPGLDILLREAEAARLDLAVASGSVQRNVHRMVAGLGLAHRFRCMVGVDGLRPKPAPDIYLRALGMLGVSATEALALEDSATGVRAARAAGLPVIGVKSRFTRHQDFSLATHVVESLDQARPFLNGGL